MSKYNNCKTTIDGIEFDSRKEASRYWELKLLQRAGRISDLKRQVEYELQPGFKVGKKKVRPIKYFADFVYTENGQEIIEDAKGKRTDVYQIKKKMFAYRYGKEIMEV